MPQTRFDVRLLPALEQSREAAALQFFMEAGEQLHAQLLGIAAMAESGQPPRHLLAAALAGSEVQQVLGIPLGGIPVFHRLESSV